MSWLHNLLSAMIAFLMAIVLAHFGAHGESPRTAAASPAPHPDRPLTGH